ncbi:hypothetical protein [Devosia naphthalenivorans]|uniref:hypothetical protein n=1 Tax=Devosia naphthalenivorans TaxID=2082392 RepID=UPI000D37BE18|nr:hypothetical protein [Devosia naphthalenivorans]
MPKMTHIRLELAREAAHPEGDQATGYDLFVPLDESGRIDPKAWRRSRDQCVVRKFKRNGETTTGLIRHGPGGRWEFDYDDNANFKDQWGIHLGDESFVLGEYISVRGPAKETHTYRVQGLGIL